MMMRWRKGKILSLLAVAGFVVAPGAAFAQYEDEQYEDEQQIGEEQQAEPGVGVAEAEIEEVSPGIWEAPMVLSFRGGPLGYQNFEGDYTSRMSQGLNIMWNFDPQVAGLNVGVETGFLFSHLGAADAGFFGASDEGSLNAGANSFIVPLQAVLGSNITDSFNIAAHLGGSLLYRSIGQSMQLGRDADTDVDSSTELFPSVAVSAGYAIGDKTSLNLRGDYIPTPADDMFVATLGVGIGL